MQRTVCREATETWDPSDDAHLPREVAHRPHHTGALSTQSGVQLLSCNSLPLSLQLYFRKDTLSLPLVMLEMLVFMFLLALSN